MTTLHILSGGAAFGLVSQLEARFAADTDCRVLATYNAVGAMRDALLAGAPCDVAILTSGLIAQLEASGQLLAGSARDLGRVKTGIAVPSASSGAASPGPTSGPTPAPTATPPTLDVSTPEALKATLLSASGIYFPDPIKATAGIHFMNVLKQLGIDASVAARLRPYPNGATAMAEMAKAAAAGEAGLIGCTQMTEIMYTAGVQWVAPLPLAFELATVYTAAVTSASQSPNAAGALVALLASPHTAAVRHAGGFDN